MIGKNMNSKRAMLEQKIADTKEALELYKDARANILKGGRISINAGPRGSSKFPMSLSEIEKAIEKYEAKLAELEGQLCGRKPRWAGAIIPRDL
jgi:hypothetical protein